MTTREQQLIDALNSIIAAIEASPAYDGYRDKCIAPAKDIVATWQVLELAKEKAVEFGKRREGMSRSEINHPGLSD